MDGFDADALAAGYAAYTTRGDRSVFEMFSADFFDNVSGQWGLVIFQIVGQWLDASFAERTVELHEVMCRDDRVMIRYTMRGRHVGNGFPRLDGRPVHGREVVWPQVHVFRVAERLVVEHWAVRDDAAMLDSIGN